MTSIEIVCSGTSAKVCQDGFESGIDPTADDAVDLFFRAMIACGYSSKSVYRAMQEYRSEQGCVDGS